MSACNTCGNNTSLPCGCEDIALAMNCTNHIGINCPINANQCASVECVECVKICNEEDMWVTVEGQYPIWWQQGWNLSQFLQSLSLSQTIGQAVVYGYFPYFSCTNVTTGSASFVWSYLQQVNVYPATAFQLEWGDPAVPGVWNIAATIPLTQNQYTINAGNLGLVPGMQYLFRMRTVDAGGGYNLVNTQSVNLYVTIPN